MHARADEAGVAGDSSPTLAGARHPLREEAQVVPIRLGELDEGGPQRLGRLLDKLLEVDDLCNTRERSNVGHLAVRALRSRPASDRPVAHRSCPDPRA